MKLHVVLSNASWAWGGVHTVTETLARGLLARGHRVTVFCRPDSPLQQRMQELVEVVPILKGMDFSPLGVARALRALRAYRPDVLLTLMDKDVRVSAIAARMLDIPVVIRRANDRPYDNAPHFRVLYGALPSAHVANSEATKRTMLSSAPWLEAARVRVIHNGIDVAGLNRAAPADLGLPAGALAIGFVGRFDERKGLLDVAAAWPSIASALPDAHLVMVGKGPLEATVRAQLAAARHVHWLGYRSDVAAVMRSLDLLLMPSHWEGFGLVAAEAMAVGVPVIAGAASSLPEIVRDEVDGVLVPVRDPAALAAAAVRLGQDGALRARMSAAARERIAAHFSADVMVERYERLLADVVARKKASR